MPQRISSRLFGPGALALLAGVAVAACGPAEQAAAPPPPPEVTVTTPVTRDVTNYAEFTGRTEAFEAVEVRARVAGELREMHFTPSSPVNEGDLLFVIEPEPYEAARDIALATIAQWEAEQDRAEANLSRLEQALQTEAVAEQDVDDARANVKTAEANLAAAKAGLVNAEINLSYTEVRSPISGLVSRNFVDLGNLVGSGENTLLTTVNRVDPIFAYYDVSESILLQALNNLNTTAGRGRTENVAVFLGLDDETGWPHEGVIDYFDNTVNASTGTIQVRGTFDNPTGKLFPGLFARIRVPVADISNAVLVEETAIGTDLGGKFVLVVGPDNIVELRHIELGPLQDDGMRVVLSNLEPAERYIINGLQRARPGLPVTPTTGD
jgi:RND family efflux transporter MFP subunit